MDQQNQWESKQPTKTEIKKEVATNDKLQATFLPLLMQAETEIKTLIVYYFYHGKSKSQLRLKVLAILKKLDKEMPKDIINRQSYITGLSLKANKMIDKQYSKALIDFLAITQLIQKESPKGIKLPKIDTPQQLIEAINTNKLKLNMWEQKKASVRVKDYEKKVKEFCLDVANEPIVASEDGKKPISIWQKAELDIRHENQMKMVDDLIESGVEYAYISSHPDASKRCEKWQGKLVALNQPSKLSGFRVAKVDGQWAYSLQDIMAQKDKYGYNNNIISGFNCRHYLIPYKKGEAKPKEYTEQDVAKQRAIETKIRQLERDIRKKKVDVQLLLKAKRMKEAKALNNEIKILVQQYKDFCNQNGYAWKPYRINVLIRNG